MEFNNFQFIFCIFFIFQFPFKAEADQIFQVKLLKFDNDKGIDETGNCCDPRNTDDPQNQICLAPCLTRFRVCLTHFQRTLDTRQTPCTFGTIVTSILGNNSFYPEKSDYIKNNPIEFHLKNRWLGYFSLVIDALGARQAIESEWHKEDKAEVIVLRVTKSEEIHATTDKQWKKSYPNHRGIELYYAYRLVCSKNFYGPDCSVYCKPRNDSLGHFICNEKGERECLPGWSNKKNDLYCMKPICANGCNATNGKCIAPNVCKCFLDGWTGIDCSQCKTPPECAHGTCKDAYECKCDSGWGGQFCNRDLHYCVRNKPCHNEGLCENSGDGSYTCMCLPGFTGKDCGIEIDECASNPCLNNGICHDLKNGYVCVCTNEFAGKSCEKNLSICAHNPCLNGGVCKERSPSYECECLKGWGGKNCGSSVAFCPMNICFHGGTCHVTDKSKLTCLCLPEFTGRYCETPRSTCGDLLCVNGGTCLDSDVGSTCQCHQCLCSLPYFGKKCEKYINLTTVAVPEANASNVTQLMALSFASGIFLVFVVVLALWFSLRKKICTFKKKSNKNKNKRYTSDNIDPKINIVIDEQFLQNPKPSAKHNKNSDKIMNDERIENEAIMLKSVNVVCQMDDSNTSGYDEDASSHYSNQQRSIGVDEIINCRDEVSKDNSGTDSNSRLPTYDEVCMEDKLLLCTRSSSVSRKIQRSTSSSSY